MEIALGQKLRVAMVSFLLGKMHIFPPNDIRTREVPSTTFGMNTILFLTLDYSATYENNAHRNIKRATIM